MLILSNYHRYREVINRDGKLVRENLGLRSLCMHFYNIDMQPEVEIHTCQNDAEYTMKLFRETYIPTKVTNVDKKPADEHSQDIPHFSLSSEFELELNLLN